MTLLPSGKVLVAGGVSSRGTLQSAEIYDPATNRWTRTGDLLIPRAVHAATLLPNGKVLVSGGGSHFDVDDETSLGGAELFDPATEQWSAIAPMASPRSGHSATLLPNGNILVAGGADDGLISAAETYNPSSGTWSLAGDMSLPRISHSATLLDSGQVLITGGSASEGTGMNAAELYGAAVLTIPSTQYCVGDPWTISVANAAPNTAIRLIGVSNDVPWDIGDWARTNTSGDYQTGGRFSNSAVGSHSVRVRIGHYLSAAVPFTVSSC
jgi:N-acetylneuraminic acid mutarotase